MPRESLYISDIFAEQICSHFVHFHGKLISVQRVYQLPPLPSSNCTQKPHTLHCGSDLHMQTDCKALGFSTHIKWEFTTTEQPSNKTEFISTFPAGEQVPVTEVHSSKTLESRKGKKKTNKKS